MLSKWLDKLEQKVFDMISKIKNLFPKPVRAAFIGGIVGGIIFSACTNHKEPVVFNEDAVIPAPIVTPVVSVTPSPEPSPSPTPVATEVPTPPANPNCKIYVLKDIGGCDSTGLCGTTGELDGQWANMKVRYAVKATYNCFTEDK